MRVILDCPPEHLEKCANIASRYVAECPDRGPGVRLGVLWTDEYTLTGPSWIAYRTKAGTIVVRENNPPQSRGIEERP